jgi:dienelactone hydrolase
VKIFRAIVVFSFACSVASTAVAAPATTAGAASPKIPLDYRAYDGWKSIRGTVLSDDGRYAAYALVPEDGDPILIVHDFTTGKDLSEPRGIEPAFTADGRYLVYAVRAPNADIHRAQREHKKAEEQPKNGLGVLDLASGTATVVDRVKDFKLPKDLGRDTLAYHLESPEPSATPSGVPSPAAASPSALPASPAPPAAHANAAPGAATSATPSPSPSPDALHKIEPGTPLVIRDLAAATETRVPDVSAYAIAHDGAFVAYAVQSKKRTDDALRVFDCATAATTSLRSGAGHYVKPTFAPKHDFLAFLTDADSFESPSPSYVLVHVDLTAHAGAPPPSPRRLVAAEVGNGSTFSAFPPSENGDLHYTRDGKRLFFGVAAAPTPVPSGTPDPVKVDIWNWHDRDLQSEQRKHADDERKRTAEAVANVDGSLSSVLASGDVRVISANENPDVALGYDDVRYRMQRSWDREYADVYAVSLAGGSRKLLMRKAPVELPEQTVAFDDTSLSPHGAFAVAYDPLARAWFSVDTCTAKRTDLTSRLHVAFYDERDDHPAPPPPYGLAGWLDGDRYVLLRDRYDVWAVDPRTGAAHALTGGIGRKRHIVFEPQNLDDDADSFDPAKPIVLHAQNEDTKDQGIWRVRTTGANAFVPQEIVMLPKAVTIAVKARNADRITAFEQSFSEMRNLWSAPNLDAPFARISDANPQRANYRWGTEHLVSYRSTWGVPLRGILYTPDGFDPHEKYPMLVYFYERFSDDYHAMPFTTPAPNTSPTLVRYVSNGYVVFVPDIAYRVGHPGESALQCLEPGVDSIVKRGFVDPERIGIAGHSWAAYQIAYVLTRTHRFRAAEAGAAVANMTSAYGGIRLESGIVREFQYEKGQSRIGATPWDRPDLYLENSALFHVENVQTPYLTIANELDGAVPQLQGIEFFTALRRLGKEAYLFSFDGEDHNLRGREQQKYWTVHLDEFFDHFLLGKPTPAWMTDGVDFLHRGERNVDRDLYGENF